MKKIIVTTLTTLLMVTNIYGADPKKMPTPKADVYVIEKPKDISLDLSYPAVLQSFKEVVVVPRISGILEKKFFEEGTYVNKGSVLYKVEDEIYKAKYEAALANYSIAEASFANASKDWERVQKLFKSKSISEEKRDASLFRYAKSKGELALAKANLNQAKIDFDYTTIKAPISGYVSLQKVDVGNYIAPTKTTSLITLSENKKLYIDFSIPAKDYQKINSGVWSLPKDKKITVDIIQNGKPMEVKAVVNFIDVNIDRDTSTVKMRAIIDNKGGTLIAGSFINVKLNGIVQKNVITIPQKALLQSAKGTIVFIANNGKAEVRPVAIGDELGDKYILNWSMLKEGDKVIVNNFFRVKPMQPVMIDKVIQ